MAKIENVFKTSKVKIVGLIMGLLAVVLLGTIGTIFYTTYKAVFRTNQLMLQEFTDAYIDGFGPKGNPNELPERDIKTVLGDSGTPDMDIESGAESGTGDSVAGSKDFVSAAVSGDGASGAGKGSSPEDIARSRALDQKDGIDDMRRDLFNSTQSRISAAMIMYLVHFDASGAVIETMNDVQPMMSDEALQSTAWSFKELGREGGTGAGLVYRVTEAADGTFYVVMMDNTVMEDSVSALLLNTVVYGAIALVILFIISWKLAGRIVKPLEDSYEKQKQFISDAGHELKTPISTVNANAELLAREVGDNQWLNNIRFENKRMQDLVTQLLDLARTENVDPVMDDVDLSRIVIGGTLPFESVAFDKGFMIDTDVVDNIHVSGDSRQLGQLISTLTDNALSHALKGESGSRKDDIRHNIWDSNRHSSGDTLDTDFMTINVSLRRDKNNAILTVSNPGEEIPVSEREKIFERFYRSDVSRELNGHYGLGLAIAKAIVTAHHGHIHVECQNGITSFVAVIPAR